MTPEESISAAFRAASREMSRGMTANKAAAFQGFLVQTSQTLNETAKAFAAVSGLRPKGSAEDIARLEAYAYNQILQATISAIMALGHFPYLEGVDSRITEENLS